MKESLVPEKLINQQALTVLVGAGVVGRAIARSHLEAGLPFVLVDQDKGQLQIASDELSRVASSSIESPYQLQFPSSWIPSETRDAVNQNSLQVKDPSGQALRFKTVLSLKEIESLGPNIKFTSGSERWEMAGTPVVIESISECLDAKQSFFRDAQNLLGDRAIYCSNTSNLQIQQIAAGLKYPERLCGMHFFMPVHARHAVEIASGLGSDRETIYQAISHVIRLKKQPIQVEDSPGFIVNRLLSPYLNESLSLLCRGVSDRLIEQAAKCYGMPLSPLELIDWIGTRTAFDAGRVFWRAFPKRVCPSPLLPALVKHQRGGRFSGGGIYDYLDGTRSIELSSKTSELIAQYRTTHEKLNEHQVMMLLAVPMWIEAVLARLDGVVSSTAELDLAMRGGLGFDSKQSWSGFFDRLGSEAILRSIQAWSSVTPAMNPPSFVLNRLRSMSPSEVIDLGRQRPAHVA